MELPVVDMDRLNVKNFIKFDFTEHSFSVLLKHEHDVFKTRECVLSSLNVEGEVYPPKCLRHKYP